MPRFSNILLSSLTIVLISLTLMLGVSIYNDNEQSNICEEKVKQKIEELKTQKIYYSDLLANDLKIKTIFKKEVMELKR